MTNVDRYIDGIFGLNVEAIFLTVTMVFCSFIPEIHSNHPWSINFILKWAIVIGSFNVNCVESGARNHIVQNA